MHPHLRSLCAALALAVTAAVPPAPAHALPVFGDAVLQTEATLFNAGSAACPATTSPPPPGDLALVENGGPRSVSVGVQGRLTNNADAGDVIDAAAAITGTGQVTSTGGDPRTFDLTGAGSVSSAASRTTSACLMHATSAVYLRTEFSVTHAGFLTLTTHASAGAVGGASIGDAVRETVADLEGRGHAFDGGVTVFLPAGSYTGLFTARALITTRSTVPETPVEVAVHGEFAIAGSRLSAVSGRGRRYVGLPDSRSCVSHALVSSVTGKRNRAEQVKRVRYFIDDVLVRTVRTPHRGAQVKLPVADGVRADVRSEVVLFPTRKGHPGKVLETTAAYEACS